MNLKNHPIKKKIDVFKIACKRQKVSSKKILSICKNLHKSNLLIIGDTIIDQYIACDALGMSAEAPVIVARELNDTEYLGGAGVVASHIKAIGANCTYLSVIGNDQAGKFTAKTLKKLKIKNVLIKDISRPTTYKIRYMIEKQKMFRVSRLKEHNISKEIEDLIIDNIKAISSDINGIIISDFVYGVITPRVLEAIILISQKKNLPVFGDLQCSSQIGNILKFRNFNTLFPTEREARTSLNNKDDGIEQIANKVLTHTNSKNLILKLGAEGFIAYHKESDGFILREHFTAITSNPIDVTGAGDSLLAGIAAALCMGGNFMEASAIGSCMSALAVEKIGNVPISNIQLTEKIKEIFYND
jgi:rfaE bifunctional protein kinase chain/domain